MTKLRMEILDVRIEFSVYCHYFSSCKFHLNFHFKILNIFQLIWNIARRNNQFSFLNSVMKQRKISWRHDLTNDAIKHHLKELDPITIT